MTEHRPGEWPVDEPVGVDEEGLYLRRAAERGRREIVLDSIRAHLEEQPTPGAVQSVARHWCADITAAAEEIARTKRRTA